MDRDRRFRDALREARAQWGSVASAERAARAGCEVTAGGVLVPYFGTPHLVAHHGEVAVRDRRSGAATPAHPAVAVLLLHYLMRADGTPLVGEWAGFRDLPDGLFYAPSFSARAERPLAEEFAPAGDEAGVALARFRAAADSLRGRPLDAGDAGYAFAALPRVPLAVLLWPGDDELAAEARVVFDASAGHYLPAEDLAGLGEALARKLLAARP
jgi:hypothetical protein